MEKSRSVSTILVFFGLDPAPPSFRHARPRVRRPSGLDSSVLGPCEKKHAEIDGILVGKGNIFFEWFDFRCTR